MFKNWCNVPKFMSWEKTFFLNRKRCSNSKFLDIIHGSNLVGQITDIVIKSSNLPGVKK